jgi:hypothetical protein
MERQSGQNNYDDGEGSYTPPTEERKREVFRDLDRMIAYSEGRPAPSDTRGKSLSQGRSVDPNASSICRSVDSAIRFSES